MRTAYAQDVRAFRPILSPTQIALASVELPEDPLTWWRTRRPDRLFRKDAAYLRLALSGTRIEGESRWREAANGDGDGIEAVAIGICVRQINHRSLNAAEIDLAASATLAFALLGDAASAVLMCWALKQRARIDPFCALLSDLWLVSDF